MVHITVYACDRPCDAIWTSTKEDLKASHSCSDHCNHLRREQFVTPLVKNKLKKKESKHCTGNLNWILIWASI